MFIANGDDVTAALSLFFVPKAQKAIFIKEALNDDPAACVSVRSSQKT